MAERFRIELESMPASVPAAIRLRRFLKLASRAFGLRCVTIEEVATEIVDGLRDGDVRLPKEQSK